MVTTLAHALQSFARLTYTQQAAQLVVEEQKSRGGGNW